MILSVRHVMLNYFVKLFCCTVHWAWIAWGREAWIQMPVPMSLAFRDAFENGFKSWHFTRFFNQIIFLFSLLFFLCVYLRNSFITFFWWYFTLVSMPWTSCDTEPKRLIRHRVPCRIMSTVRGCVRATRLVSDEVPRVYFL